MLAPWRPRFDTLYQGEWPYGPEDCVGIRMAGKPSSGQRFRAILQAHHNCPSAVSRRILDDLENLGVRESTVRPYLDFDRLARELRGVRVKLTIIPPKPGGQCFFKEKDKA